MEEYPFFNGTDFRTNFGKDITSIFFGDGWLSFSYLLYRGAYPSPRHVVIEPGDDVSPLPEL